MLTKHKHPFRNEFETQVFSSDETVFFVIQSGVSTQTFYLTVESAEQIAQELIKAAREPGYE